MMKIDKEKQDVFSEICSKGRNEHQHLFFLEI